MELSKYALEPLRVDDQFILYRGHLQSEEQAALLLLAPVSTHPANEALKRLEHEFSLRSELDPSWAVQPLALSKYKGQTALVLSDPGGQTLNSIIDGPMEIRQFLRLAIGLTSALNQLHRQGLVHKDVKPSNALVRPATDQVWLTGFGIASRLPRERQSPASPEVIAGTLAYMAPEQTGRMNRSIDSRSDLYSLGVTLYELLLGTLPFAAADPTEWVHCHIAKEPVPPSDRLALVPESISAIIMRLLAKTAEDRYQSAAGLEADLRRCLTEWESQARIGSFALGARDASDRLHVAGKLYGRDVERKALLDAFEEVVATGKPMLVLVSGYSGVGKSSLVNELQKSILPSRGIFISGKFDQHKRDIPYATLAQAFQTLIRQMLGQTEVQLSRWRDTIRAALGTNAQMIIDLTPELELIIGKQPPVPELPPTEARVRFHRVLRSFLGAFARKEHPLVLLLDDLQWVDAATLQLLEDLANNPDIHYLLLIGAFRDNEVNPAHPLMETLNVIREAGAIVQNIALAPLSIDRLTEFVADALRCNTAVAGPLVTLLHHKTLGNPFFAIQFMTALRDERLLTFDASEGIWDWDMAPIEARGFTDNVVDLMIGKLKRLPAATQEALKQFSCLGNTADVVPLMIIRGKPEDEVRRDLWEAVRLDFIVRLEESDSFKFAHDRVREGAYALVPEESRAEIHLQIGRKLLTGMTPELIGEKVFDIANQLNAGAGLVTEWAEKRQIAELNLRAAKRAKAAAAYTSACTYLGAAMTLLGSRGWWNSYELAFSVWFERAECEFLNGNFDIAERLIGELLQHGTTRVDRAGAYRIKIDLHVVKSEHPQAVNSALECLRLFGIDVPPHPTSEQLQSEYESVWNTLGNRSISGLIDLPSTSDKEVQAAMGVLSVLFAPSINTDFNLTCLHLCKMINLSLRHGNTDASASGYVWFGAFLGPVFHRYQEGYEFGQLACQLVERHNLIAYRAKTYFAMEICALWSQPVATGLRHLESAFRAGVETGDLTVACYSCNHVITDLILRGDRLVDVWNESLRRLDFVRSARFRDVVDVILPQQRFILNMQGKTSSFSTFSDTEFDESVFESELGPGRMKATVCWYWILKLQARFIYGDNKIAIDAGTKAKALLWSSVGHIQLLDYYYYCALAVAAVWDDNASDGHQEHWRELLKLHVDQLQEWAENGSSTFRDKFELVAAEVSRIEGRDMDAMRFYEQAIRSAHENGFIQNEAIANEVAARFYAGRGFGKIADAYLREARYWYRRWGADGKVRQLDQLYPHLREEMPVASPTSTIEAPLEHLDLATVIKVSQAVSGELVLERLVDRLMRIALEHAGAERGLLLVRRGDEQQIEAEATADYGAVIVRRRETALEPYIEFCFGFSRLTFSR